MSRSVVILAGGRSRRLGRGKPWVRLGGSTVLERVMEAARGALEAGGVPAEEVGALILCVRDGTAFADRAASERVVLPDDVRIVEDDPGLAGPVAGLVAGLEAVRDGSVVALAADMPFVSPLLIAGLFELLDVPPGVDAVVPVVAGRDQPLCAAYRASVAAAARGLGAGRATGEPENARGPSLAVVLDALSVRRVSSVGALGPDRLSVMCRGIDTPEDLAWAESRERDARTE